MNQKLLSVLFSALLCTTWGHEYQRAHELASSNRHHHLKHEAKHLSHAFRISPPSPSCRYQCPDIKLSTIDFDANLDLRLFVVDESKAITVLNSSSHTGIAFDVDLLVLILQADSSSAILLDINADTGIYFEKGGWTGDRALQDYLKELGSLSNIKKLGKGETFKLKSVPQNISKVAAKFLATLGLELKSRVEANPDSTVSIIVVLAITLRKSIDVAKPILSKLGERASIIDGGLLKFVNTINGLRILSERVPNLLNTLLTDNFEVTLLFAASSGLETILYLIQQAGLEVDIGKLLGGVFKNSDGRFNVSVTLDGGIFYGIAGIIATIQYIELYTDKKINLESLIDVLIQVVGSNTEKISKEKWLGVVRKGKSLFQAQIDKYGPSDIMTSIVKLFADIEEDKLVIQGVNVSAIINLIISSSGNSNLSVLVNILVQLKPIVSITTSIATLLLRLLWFIISGKGFIYINALLPEINIPINLSAPTNIIKQILSNVDITKIWSYVIKLDVIGVLTHLPVIGPVYTALENALKATGEAANVSLSSALKETGSILATLKNWIWYGLGLGGGEQPSDGGIAGSSLAGGGMTITWTLSIGSGSSGGSTSSGSGGSGSSSGGSGSTGSGGGWSWSWGSSGGSGSSGSSGGSSDSGGSGGGSSSGSGSSGSSGGSGSASGSSGSSGSSGGSSSGSSSGGVGGSSGLSGSSGSSGSGSGSGGSSGSGSSSGGSSGSGGWSWIWGGSGGAGASGSGSSGSSGGSSGSSGSGSGSSGSSGSGSGGSSSGSKGGSGISWNLGWGR